MSLKPKDRTILFCLGKEYNLPSINKTKIFFLLENKNKQHKMLHWIIFSIVCAFSVPDDFPLGVDGAKVWVGRGGGRPNSLHM